MNVIALGLTLLGLIFFPTLLLSQEASNPGIYIIFDASGSMWGELLDKSKKITVAKQVLNEFLAGDFQGQELALRVYGHRSGGDCRDSQLMIPFGSPQKVAAQAKPLVQAIQPKGKTPIDYSLREALKDFGNRSGQIILISDGIETCDADPCALVKAWKEKNINIQVHVVGLGLDEKSKASLQCISKAAGTEYHDAQSATALGSELNKIKEQVSAPVLILKGQFASGKVVPIRGKLLQNGQKVFEVASHQRNGVPPGTYTLIAGVPTKNGKLYRPVTKMIQVGKQGETLVSVQVQSPPSVKVKFMEGMKIEGPSLVMAFQNGKKVFKFRGQDQVYLDEGAYEFRTQPNPENNLSVTETFGPGDHKEIQFNLVQTVHLNVKLLASGSGIWLPGNPELWQEGKKKYGINRRSGRRVLPGTYELRLVSEHTPYVQQGFQVGNQDKQVAKISVPVGHVTIIYQKPDGSRDQDKRSFVGRGPVKKGAFTFSGKKHPFVPGTYNVVGWQGNYDRVVFNVKIGEDIEVVLRAKP